MTPGPGETRSLPTRGGFVLHELEWTAPDRLQVTGEFTSGATLPAAPPVLVVRGAEGTHRLPAVPKSLSRTPAEGELWRTEFAWVVAPIPFDAAVLEFGDDIAIELGTPKAREDSQDPSSPPDSGAARVHLQSEMFALQAEVREARAETDRMRTDLARATEDLESERAGRAADADRFRQSLAEIEGVAHEALAEEKRVTQELETELERAREAIEVRDAELQRLREELEAAGDASSELGALRTRVSELERAGEEAEQTRADLAHAEAEAERARAESERLSGRIAQIRQALDDPM